MARAYTQHYLAPFMMTEVNVLASLGMANTDVDNEATFAAWIANIEALSVKASKAPAVRRAVRNLKVGKAAGVFTDTNIAAADTIAGVRTILTTIDANLSTKHRAAHLDG